MTDLKTIFTPKNARKIWKQLRDSEVPIVSASDYKRLDQVIATLYEDLRTNAYMPAIGHGYLGFPKKAGCTRFVPISTKEDMTVYYLVTFSLEDVLFTM